MGTKSLQQLAKAYTLPKMEGDLGRLEVDEIKKIISRI
jgi:hypothetical protein